MIYRPRMTATLSVPLLGTRAQRLSQEKNSEVITLRLRPKRIRLEKNDHNHADSISLSCDWYECGVDPRLLDDGVLTVYIGNADDDGVWNPGPKDVRFIGLVRDVDANRDSDAPAAVTIECVDYTSLFLDANRFGSAGIPTYSQNLEEAWRTIVSQTPGAEVLADNLVFIGVQGVPKLGDAVSERFRALSSVPTKPDTDAWAVWQQCVGMCGLISHIDGDRVIVTTATNYYTEADPPSLVWGKNVLKWRESRNTGVVKKGVGLTSYDPISGTTIEAVFPPVGDERVRRKRVKAKKVQSAATVRSNEQREWFVYPGVTQVEQLERIAERVWEEMSRQELEGHITTAEMWTNTLGGVQFDLLRLGAGVSVHIGVDGNDRQLLSSMPSDSARREFLMQRGYTPDAANLIVSNVKGLSGLESKFFVKTVCITLEVDESGGQFTIDVDYINRIQIDGSATGT